MKGTLTANKKEIAAYFLPFLLALIFLLAANGSKADVFCFVAFASTIFLFCVLTALRVLFHQENMPIHKVYLVWSLAFGTVFTLAIPTYMTPDEPSHLYTAYAVSNRMLRIENVPSIKIRACDRDAGANGIFSVNIAPSPEIREHYNMYYKSMPDLFADDPELVDTGVQPLGADPYMYAMPALGITIGRLLGLGTVPTYLLGTLFNLILYVFMTTAAIYFIPMGKEILFTLALMPIVLQQCASFSYDCFIISFSFIVTALSFLLLKRLKCGDGPVGRLLLFWGMATARLVPAQYCMCAPLFLFSVPMYRQARDIKSRRQVALASMLVLLFVASYMTLRYIKKGFLHPASWAGYDLLYVVTHPKKIIRMCFNTVRSYGDFHLLSFLGNRMGWLNITPPVFIVLGYIFCLLVAHGRKGDTDAFVGTEERLSCYAMLLMLVAIPFAAMLLIWTPAESFLIEGVQGRYFVSCVLLFLLTLKKSSVSFSASVSGRLTTLVPLLNIIYLTFLWSFIAQPY